MEGIDQESYKLGMVDALTKALIAIVSLKDEVRESGGNEWEFIGISEAQHEIQQLLNAEIK